MPARTQLQRDLRALGLLELAQRIIALGVLVGIAVRAIAEAEEAGTQVALACLLVLALAFLAAAFRIRIGAELVRRDLWLFDARASPDHDPVAAHPFRPIVSAACADGVDFSVTTGGHRTLPSTMDIKKIAGAVLSVVLCVGGWLAYRAWASRESGAAVVSGGDNQANKPTGSFKATGGPLGTWEMAVTGCQSGEKHHFDGVILYDKADKSRHVRLVRHGNKYEVFAQLPSGSEPVAVAKCKTTAAIEKTGTNVNFHDELRGKVEVACANLTGSATFPSCY